MKLYQIDAFAEKVFTGNPAAVCPLESWPDDTLLQSIAEENNLAETAFYVPVEGGYELRWFTPNTEVELCGHATLAAAFVLFHHEGHHGDSITFYSRHSGILTVEKKDDFLTLDFPVDTWNEVPISDNLTAGFSLFPKEAYKGKTDYLLIFESEKEIKSIIPDITAISKVMARGIIISAPGDEVDFVSRFFAPRCSVSEDPVTGSAHTTLTPFWAKRLGKTKMTAMQLSDRTGKLEVELLGDRVRISGRGKLYLKGEIFVNNYPHPQ